MGGNQAKHSGRASAATSHAGCHARCLLHIGCCGRPCRLCGGRGRQPWRRPAASQPCWQAGKAGTSAAHPGLQELESDQLLSTPRKGGGHRFKGVPRRPGPHADLLPPRRQRALVRERGGPASRSRRSCCRAPRCCRSRGCPRLFRRCLPRCWRCFACTWAAPGCRWCCMCTARAACVAHRRRRGIGVAFGRTAAEPPAPAAGAQSVTAGSLSCASSPPLRHSTERAAAAAAAVAGSAGSTRTAAAATAGW